MTRYNALFERYEGIRKSIEYVENEKFERLVKKDRIEDFMKILRDRDGLLDEFEGELWNWVIDAVKVYADGKIVVKDVMEVTI